MSLAAVPARLMLVAGLAVMLVACAAPAPIPTAEPAPAGGRAPWLVRDVMALVEAVPPPPALPLAPPAAPADSGLIAAWREPASPWMEAGLRAVAAEASDPPRTSRALMLLAVAIDDALVVAAAARERGLEVSDHAAVAEAAGRVLAFSHPLLDAVTPGEREAATWAGVWLGEATPAGVLAGRHLGAAVAAEALAWAASAGPEEAPHRLTPDAPGVWSPTAPGYAQPLAPAWGQARTVVIGDPAALHAPAPPAWGSPAMEAQAAAFVAAQRRLTERERALAAEWGGAITPPAMWVEIAGEHVRRHVLAPTAAAATYAAAGVALYDAGVACWEVKYRHMFPRPIQAMESRDPAWRPLLPTPPHPSYPSGHACFSGAASAVLAAAFPADAEALRRLAEEAARSRIYGGIHWPIDGEAGLAIGAQVGALAAARMPRP